MSVFRFWLLFGLIAFSVIQKADSQTENVTDAITVVFDNGVEVSFPEGFAQSEAREIVELLDSSENKYDAAEVLLKGSGSVYWFELLNVIDEWDRVILVFGYGNNATACDALLKAAEEDAPFRRFRCVPGAF